MYRSEFTGRYKVNYLISFCYKLSKLGSNVIKNWPDISSEKWESLLLGNGFSIGVSKKFRYDSLLDVVDIHGIKMYPHARNLFNKDKIGTANFEEILKVIYHAYLVNFHNLEAIRTLYFNVRKSLIEAVNIAHVSFDQVPVDFIHKNLSNYNIIFTTNYDLIPYWSMMSNDFKGYCDYFWNESCTFDPKKTEIWYDNTPIYYLHGAIHLRTTPDGKNQKVRATGETSIQNIIGERDLEHIPLFISEGKSDIKLRRIRENDYLNFCYNELMMNDKNMVVFGHGLDKQYDEHILNAISTSRIEKLAVSVYSRLSQEDKDVFICSVRAFFASSAIDLHFFESSTHPLVIQGI
jgi:hypothetical protein